MSSSLLQDHAQHPRHRREVLDNMSCVGHAANPMCADAVDVGVVIEGGIIVDAAFCGKGCALAVGSASLLCTWLWGKRIADVEGTLATLPHLEGEAVGRMREGCVKVSVVATGRALAQFFTDV